MLWLIIGGSEQGKLALASQQFAEQTGQQPRIHDVIPTGSSIDNKLLLEEQFMQALEYDIVDHVHLLLRQLSSVCNQAEFDVLVTRWLKALQDKHGNHTGRSRIQILVLDDIGCGLVPLQYDDRIWRERCGRLYCRLTAQATIVQRAWAGIIQTLKGEQSL